jgi:uncharacterized LabA/DUF88 family protein
MIYFAPNLKQKGADIKIELDVTWISFNHIARNIVIIAADSDFVPALKTARRNGVFVHLFTLGHPVKKELLENADVTTTSSIADLLALIQTHSALTTPVPAQKRRILRAFVTPAAKVNGSNHPT